MIHEGTHGIQALDLLGRKVRLQGGRAMALLGERMGQTLESAAQCPELIAYCVALENAWKDLRDATEAAWRDGDPTRALANAVPYMQAFGHTVLAWVWLDVACAAQQLPDSPAREGRLAAARYFFHYELPKTPAWLAVVGHQDMTCADLSEEAF